MDGSDHARWGLGARRHYALTWGIADSFGGMTEAMLHRSRAFVRDGGVPVSVLTFDHRTDYALLATRLRESGDLIDGMTLTNLWDWLREHPLPGGSLRLDRDVFDPLAAGDPASVAVVSGDGRVLRRERHGGDGRVLQRDHFRLDGTLLLSERRDTRERGRAGGTSVVLCDGSGAPVRSWNRMRYLYEAWLDRLTRTRPSALIVDSKTLARSLLGYRRAHVVTAHVVHASHLVGSRRPDGRLRESRRRVFERLDGFDLVAVLTERQRADVERLLGPQPGVRVIPTSRRRRPTARAGAAESVAVGANGETPPADATPPADETLPAGETPPARPVGAGAVLAALTARKRVGDAVRAVLSPGAPSGATLDVYGDGDEADALRSLSAELGGGLRVRFHGFDPAARNRLDRASYLLLTSTSEGLPLVLIGAMAAGCVPIAYDIPYGPADLIRDRRNGFLVPDGDVAGLVDALRELAALDDRARQRMRRRARRSARAFDDHAVTRLWARELRAAAERRT